MQKVAFLSDEWCALVLAEAQTMPVLAGATGVRAASVVYPDDTKRSYTMRFVDGVITAVEPGLPSESSYRIEMPLDIFLALQQGDYEMFDRGMLNGMIRFLGDPDGATTMAPLMRSKGYQSALIRVHERTDYGV